MIIDDRRGITLFWWKPVEEAHILFWQQYCLDEDLLNVGDEQWIHKVDGERFFLRSTSPSPTLAYFQRLLVLRHSEGELVHTSRGVTVSQLKDVDIPPRTEEVLGLFPGHL